MPRSGRCELIPSYPAVIILADYLCNVKKKKQKNKKTTKQQEQNQTLSALLALKLMCHYPGLSGTCSEDNWTYPGGQAHDSFY